MVIQKTSELVVTSDSPIDDIADESSEGPQGPRPHISENPASPMTSLGNEVDEEAKDLDEGIEYVFSIPVSIPIIRYNV